MKHEQIKKLVPLLAINAVSDDEENDIQAHMASCAECLSMMEMHLDAAVALARSAVPLNPPASLKQRLMSQIAAESAVVPQQSPAPARPFKPAAQPPPAAGSPGAVLPLPAQQSERRPRWLAPLAGIAAAAVFIAVAMWGWMVVQINRQNQLLEQTRQALAIAGTPGVDRKPMVARDAAGGAGGQAFVAETGAAIIMTGMKDPRDEVYTLWLISGNRPVSVGDFRPDESGTAVIRVAQSVDRDMTMAVTREPSEGNKSPKGPVILST